MLTVWIFLKKAWVFVRTYWQYIVLAVAVIFGYLLFRRQDFDFSRQLSEIQDRHQRELEEIRQAYDEESKRRAENEAKLAERLAVIQQQFDDAQKELDSTKKKQVEELVRQYGDQPDVLAQKLSALTGFTVIMPEDS